MARRDKNGVVWMSINDAAKQLSMTPQQVYNQIQNGTIHAAKTFSLGQKIKWRVSSVEVARIQSLDGR